MEWRPKQFTREQLAERRADAARLLEKGDMKQAEIARYLGVTPAALSRWKRRIQAEGPQALRLRKASGRPPKLTEAERRMLAKKLEEGALAAGFPTQQWTQARIKRVIEREFGVSFHTNSISRLLDQMGWSVQKVEGRAAERDEELITAWLRRDWPRIKKVAAKVRQDRV